MHGAELGAAPKQPKQWWALCIPSQPYLGAAQEPQCSSEPPPAPPEPAGKMAKTPPWQNQALGKLLPLPWL